MASTRHDEATRLVWPTALRLGADMQEFFAGPIFGGRAASKILPEDLGVVRTTPLPPAHYN